MKRITAFALLILIQSSIYAQSPGNRKNNDKQKMNPLVGTWRLIEYADFEKSIVTHHVKGGSLPWYIDTDQPRPFTLKGDSVIIGNNTTWRRVLVRAD